MSRSTLPTLPVLGYRKDGRPIFPIMGGSELPKQDDPPKQDPPKQDPPQGPVEATDENGVALGFPKDTAVAEMKPEQQAAYWRNEAKKQQKKVPSNLTELQQAAQKWEEYQRTQQTPAQQEIEKARQEAATAARAEAAKESAVALLRVSLHTRGKNDAEIDELLQFTSPESFLNEGKVDAGKVSSFLDKIAPTRSGGGGGLPGQGRYEQTATDKAAAGKAEAERRGFKPADRSNSSLIPR